jgi:HlyD family secretion protein
MRATILLLFFVALVACEPNGDAHAGSLQGVVEIDEVALSFEIAGPLEILNVVRGQRVGRGDVLAQVDSELARTSREAKVAEVEAIRAELALLRAGTRTEEVRATSARVRAARAVEKTVHGQLERQQKLVEEGALPSSSLDPLVQQLSQARGERQALEQQLVAERKGARPEQIAALEARLMAAEAGLTLADEQLARHVLRAPGDGAVIDVHLEPGELAAPGVPVVTVGDVTHPYVDVFVPQADLAGIEVGADAELTVDTYDHPFSGEIEHVFDRTEFTPRYLFSQRERATLVVRARVRLSDPKGELPAGVPAFVRVTGHSSEASPSSPGS